MRTIVLSIVFLLGLFCVSCNQSQSGSEETARTAAAPPPPPALTAKFEYSDQQAANYNLLKEVAVAYNNDLRAFSNSVDYKRHQGSIGYSASDILRMNGTLLKEDVGGYILQRQIEEPAFNAEIDGMSLAIGFALLNNVRGSEDAERFQKGKAVVLNLIDKGLIADKEKIEAIFEAELNSKTTWNIGGAQMRVNENGEVTIGQ